MRKTEGLLKGAHDGHAPAASFFSKQTACLATAAALSPQCLTELSQPCLAAASKKSLKLRQPASASPALFQLAGRAAEQGWVSGGDHEPTGATAPPALLGHLAAAPAKQAAPASPLAPAKQRAADMGAATNPTAASGSEASTAPPTQRLAKPRVCWGGSRAGIGVARMQTTPPDFVRSRSSRKQPPTSGLPTLAVLRRTQQARTGPQSACHLQSPADGCGT